MAVLITGYSGFVGRSIKNNFDDHSINVLTLGRSNSANIFVDLSKSTPDLNKCGEISRVIHVAGKAHISSNNKLDNQEFYKVNYLGTIHLCKALKRLNTLPKQFVYISSVSVYGQDYGLNINESHVLHSKTPYGRSKILAERYLLRWGRENGVKIFILRLPLVFGKKAPGNLHKMIQGIKKRYYLRLSNNNIRKSIVHVEDVSQLIVRCSDAEGIYNLTDRYHPSLNELEDAIMKQLHVKYIFSLPRFFIKPLAWIGDRISFFPFNSTNLDKLTHSLTFDDTKAVTDLDWKPKAVLDNFSL